VHHLGETNGLFLASRQRLSKIFGCDIVHKSEIGIEEEEKRIQRKNSASQNLSISIPTIKIEL